MSDEYEDDVDDFDLYPECEEESPLGTWEPRISDILNYRKVAIAVVGSYLGLEDAFINAVLQDRMDEYLTSVTIEREEMKENRYSEYLTLLSNEIIVRYAATAAETLAAHPDSRMAKARRIMGDTGALGLTDDVNAVVRVHEIFEFLESPDENTEAEQLLLMTKRALCHYYNACAFDLVKGPLLSVIIQTAEELFRNTRVDAAHIRALIIASEHKDSSSGA